MDALLKLFSNNILPIFLTAGAGFLLGKAIDINPRTISRVTFYIFSPCLVFNLLTVNQLGSGESLQIVGYAIAVTLLICLVTFLLGKAIKLERTMLVAVMLTTTFTNAGNFGLSLNAFAYGDEVMAYAGLYFVMSASLMYTLGVLIASMGQANLKESLISLIKLPTIYAVVLAFLFNALDWTLPLPLERTTSLLGQAAIPTMLVLLGLQLGRANLSGQVKEMGVANILRLVVAPALAIALAYAFGLQGHAFQAGVTEASMPTAVMATVLATEFDVHPAFVTTVVTTTTLLSPLMLTPLLAFLGA